MARCRINLLNVEFTDNYYDAEYWKLYDKLEKVNSRMRSLIYDRRDNNQLIYRLLNEVAYLEEKGKCTSCARRRIIELKAENLALSAEICALSNERDTISEQLEEFQNGARW